MVKTIEQILEENALAFSPNMEPHYMAELEGIWNDACIESGDFGPVNEWNREHIWQHGGRFTPAGLLSRVLEAEFDPGYYIDYLENKYTELYGL